MLFGGALRKPRHDAHGYVSSVDRGDLGQQLLTVPEGVMSHFVLTKEHQNYKLHIELSPPVLAFVKRQ
jgi:hypothetical protein